MLKRFQSIERLIGGVRGQTMTEYAVVLGALVLAVIGVVGLLSDAVVNRLGNAAAIIRGLVP